MEGHFDNVIDSVWRVRQSTLSDLCRIHVLCNNDVLRAGGRRYVRISRRTDGRHDIRTCEPRQANGALPNGAGSSLYKDHAFINRAGDMNGTVRRNARNAKAAALLKRNAVRQAHRLICRNHNILRRGTKRTIALSAKTPGALPDTGFLDAGAYPVDDSGTIAMGNDAGKCHTGAELVSPLLDVSRIDAGGTYRDSDFAGPWLRIRKLAYLQDVRRCSLLFIPGRLHGQHAGSKLIKGVTAVIR